jgi:hypothetical protein
MSKGATSREWVCRSSLRWNIGVACAAVSELEVRMMVSSSLSGPQTTASM